MYEQSHRDYLRSGYLHHRLPVRPLIITVITPLPTKSWQKCQRTEAGERGNYWHADASAWDVAALDAKYTKELADAKAENDALRDDVAAGRRRLHIKAVCQSVREATTASGVDNAQPPPTGRHRWTGLFHPQREADHYAKTTGRNPEVYWRAVQIELPISMGNSCNYCEHTHALPAEYKCLK